ncbi:hypothetical protein F0562_007900 [Nyssa sinensis]|uniref:PGG domain-containing protein n=1 Tax=Nyssa sinensis TaxID=561372 RepID=A0A5J5A679_9ASTE|nr:hypothetical protein F0562_007900 [Nyssa sinensis]
MDQRLVNAAQQGNIDQFYALIHEDPYLLERLNAIPFLDTPLHIAAAAGHTHFAVEIASLKPSFCSKLNPDGLSPLHLAVQNLNTELAKRLVSMDNELVRVQGKERITPLHYAVELNNIDLLVEFLYTCPKSIGDLTIRCETAVHIAVKNKKLEAFKVLFEWLRRTDNKKVMKLLINKVKKNDRNSEGLTALDIVSWLPQEVDKKEVEHILCHAGAKNASSSSLPARVSTLADLLSLPEGFNERWLRYVINRQRKISSDLRNVILVVAVLVATASYQAVLNPPGGVGHGKSAMAKDSFFVFAFLNSTAFVASMAVIVVVLHINYFSLLLHIALFFLMSSYVVSLFVISPLTNMAAKLFVLLKDFRTAETSSYFDSLCFRLCLFSRTFGDIGKIWEDVISLDEGTMKGAVLEFGKVKVYTKSFYPINQVIQLKCKDDIYSFRMVEDQRIVVNFSNKIGDCKSMVRANSNQGEKKCREEDDELESEKDDELADEDDSIAEKANCDGFEIVELAYRKK